LFVIWRWLYTRQTVANRAALAYDRTDGAIRIHLAVNPVFRSPAGREYYRTKETVAANHDTAGAGFDKPEGLMQ